MREKFADFISEKCPGAQPLLIVVRGSQAYGTNLPTSDTDYAGVYIQQKEDIYGFRYKEQINDDKNDTVFYEVHRFLELVSSNNPTILELLNTPEDCIIYKDPFLTKFWKIDRNLSLRPVPSLSVVTPSNRSKKRRDRTRNRTGKKKEWRGRHLLTSATYT
jgi:hypothetical protein